jgi:transposase
MMPSQSLSFPALPAETARAVEAVFGKGNIYLTIGDQIGPLLTDVNPGDLGPNDEASITLRTLLALVTVFQFAENLPDRRAAEALRSRLDWKYALHLPLNYPGLEPLTLCEFRKFLMRDVAARQVVQQILERLATVGLLRNGHQQPDVLQVLTAICCLSCLERIVEAMRMALETLATYQPEWLRTVARPHWYERYQGTLLKNALPYLPHDQEALAQAIGADAWHLLEAIERANAALARMPEARDLRRVWHQQFERSANQVTWQPPSSRTCHEERDVATVSP